MGLRLRKTIFVGSILYTLLVLYFMFFAFGRMDHVASQSRYTFMLIPEAVPLLFPHLTELSFSWIYDLGNVAAFMPFGLIIPLLYRTSFVKFICWFVLMILVLETIQSLTFLGTFDVDDVISNTLGAAIGFCVYKVGFSSKIVWTKLIAAGLTGVILLVGIMGISEAIHYAVIKREGPVHALNEMKELTGNMPMTTDLPILTVDGEKIEPKINMYSSEGQNIKTYTYILGNKKDIMLYSYFGIPDNNSEGELILTVDGNVIAQLNEQYNKHAEALDIPFDKINEITITLKGNAKLWDVTFSQMKHWWD